MRRGYRDRYQVGEEDLEFLKRMELQSGEIWDKSFLFKIVLYVFQDHFDVLKI